jgi:hypothetical protein
VDVKRWNDNLAAGSPLTAERWTRRLGRYCEINDKLPLTEGPKMLWHLDRSKSILVQANYNLLLDTIRRLEKTGYDRDYIKGIKTSVVSWLRFGGIHLEENGPIKIKRNTNPNKQSNVRTPEVHEVRMILADAPLRGKVSVVLVAWAGLRWQSLGNSEGIDGLRLKDFPELNIKELRFETIPATVIVRPELSKAGHQYLSLLLREGTEIIVAYLKSRVTKGEILTPETPLMKAFGNKKKPGDFVGTDYLRWEIARVIKNLEKAGLMPRCRPNDLRAFFDTQMLIAQQKLGDKLPQDFRVFWMGHRGSMEANYTTNRHSLPISLMNAMREAYSKASYWLLQSVNPEEIRELSKEFQVDKDRLVQLEKQVEFLVNYYKENLRENPNSLKIARDLPDYGTSVA